MSSLLNDDYHRINELITKGVMFGNIVDYIIPIAKIIIGIKDKQLELLEELKIDITTILDEPIRTGLSWLSEIPSARNQTEIEYRIQKAEENFMRAISMYHNQPFREGIAEYFYAICQFLKGHKRDGCKYLINAKRSIAQEKPEVDLKLSEQLTENVEIIAWKSLEFYLLISGVKMENANQSIEYSKRERRKNPNYKQAKEFSNSLDNLITAIKC